MSYNSHCSKYESQNMMVTTQSAVSNIHNDYSTPTFRVQLQSKLTVTSSYHQPSARKARKKIGEVMSLLHAFNNKRILLEMKFNI